MVLVGRCGSCFNDNVFFLGGHALTTSAKCLTSRTKDIKDLGFSFMSDELNLNPSLYPR